MLLVDVADAGVGDQFLARLIDEGIGKPTLDGVPIFDAGKAIALIAVLPLRGEARREPALHPQQQFGVRQLSPRHRIH